MRQLAAPSDSSGVPRAEGRGSGLERQRAMLRLLKILVYGSGLLFLLMVVVGVFLPRRWEARAARTMEAAPERLQSLLEQPAEWVEWMPWSAEKDPSLVVSFSGPVAGEGAALSFAGDMLGAGTMTIVAVRPAGGVDYELRFRGVEEPTRGSLLLAPTSFGTRVEWTDGGDLGANPIPRVFKGLFEAKLALDFDRALQKLEARAKRQG